MSEKEEIKTATEILHEYGIYTIEMNDEFNCQLLTSMERYADQKVYDLQSEVERLKKEKIDMIVELKKLVTQAENKAFEIIEGQKAEIERLKREC